MEMNINIEDYLSQESMTEIVRELFAAEVKKHLCSSNEIERILTNSCYYFVFEEVAKIVPNYQEIMVEKVKKLIVEKDLHFETFYRKSVGCDSNSLAITLIEGAVRQNKQIIDEKVRNAIDNFNVEKFITEAFGRSWEDTAGRFQDIADAMYQMVKKND